MENLSKNGSIKIFTFGALNYFQFTIDKKASLWYNKVKKKPVRCARPKRVKDERCVSVMNSIAQEEPLVKWSAKKRESLKVSQKMIDAGFKTRGIRMQNCGDFINFKLCPDCGKSFISSTNLCRDRLCPTCSWRLSLKKFAEMCSVLSAISELHEYGAGFLTLTVKNCRPENLSFTLKKMAADWNRMLQLKFCKEHFVGWARSVEITYNEKTREFHPHFHIILLYDGKLTGGDMNFNLRKAWQKSARLDYEPITDFRVVGAESATLDCGAYYRAICETFKYAVKSDDLKDMPIGIFRTFVQAIQGVRFVSYGGLIKEVRKALGLRDTDEDDGNEIELSREHCDKCGSVLLQAVMQWSLTEGQYKILNL